MRSLRWILPILLLSVRSGMQPQDQIRRRRTRSCESPGRPSSGAPSPGSQTPKPPSRNPQRTGKPVLMDLWQIGCANCEHLDKDVWPRKDIADLAKGFVPVKLNGQQHTEWSGKYNVSGYPTTLFLTADGSLLGRVRGEPFPEDMLSAMKDALAKAKSSK